MLRRISIALPLLFFLVFSFSSVESDAERALDFKAAKKMEKVLKVKEVQLNAPLYSAHRKFLNKDMIGNVTFCGIDLVIEKVDDKKLLIKWGGDKSKEVSKKGGIVTIASGEESCAMGVVYSEKDGWGYYNGTVREAKLERGTVRFYDINCNGKYLEQKK